MQLLLLKSDRGVGSKAGEVGRIIKPGTSMLPIKIVKNKIEEISN
jgi:hypothetical protein